jgi:hypothetical protein
MHLLILLASRHIDWPLEKTGGLTCRHGHACDIVGNLASDRLPLGTKNGLASDPSGSISRLLGTSLIQDLRVSVPVLSRCLHCHVSVKSQ